jgi:hypothetical protein
VDLDQCAAEFNDNRHFISFKWTQAVKHTKPSSFIAFRLEPIGKPLPPSANGVGGRLRIAVNDEIFEQQVLLFPLPPYAVVCRSIDVGQSAGKTLVLFQKSPRVPVRMELVSETHVWVVGCAVREAGDAGSVDVVGFEDKLTMNVGEKSVRFAQPVLLRPKQKTTFTLLVDTSQWLPGQAQKLSGRLQLYGMPACPFRQTLQLIKGARIEFHPSVVQHVPSLQVGQEHRVGFQLSLAEAAPNDQIKITSYSINATPEGDWLKVETPPRGRLPLTLKVGTREDLILLIDTRRLNRAGLDGAILQGEVHLIDDRSRHWICHVQIEVSRVDFFSFPIAFDWGTSNTCAAFSEGKGQRFPPRPVSLGEYSPRRPELTSANGRASKGSSGISESDEDHEPDPDGMFEIFPSNVYFKDISDVNNPIILIGPEVESLAQRRPECHLRSLKRKFQFRKQVFVMDEAGSSHVYPVEELVLHLLRCLVARAESGLKREIQIVGLTFPTKWPRSILTRFREVAKRLEIRLNRERQVETPADGSGGVVVESPEIDEANAVAIELLASGWVDQNLAQRDRFYLIAYDFGGGTIDTSVLEVVREPGPYFRTNYIGIGGRRDFGGDEVTRAVMMLLHQRLTSFLRGLPITIPDASEGDPEPKLIEIPLVADGDSVDGHEEGAVARWLSGRKNWDTLWRIAENVKISLCRGEDVSGTVAGFLGSNGDNIDCVYSVAVRQPPSPSTKVLTLEEVLRYGEKLPPALELSLEQACRKPLQDIDGANNGMEFNVERRIRDTIDELRYQTWVANIEPDVIVLAGGGCRLPLVRQMVAEAFPQVPAQNLKFDIDFSKRRVCYGLANYLAYKQAVKIGEFARSVDVIHHPIGIKRRAPHNAFDLEFFPIIPVGASLDQPHVLWNFEFAPNQLGNSNRLMVYVQTWSNSTKLDVRPGDANRKNQQSDNWMYGGLEIPLGYFELAKPPTVLQADCVAQALPNVGAQVCEASLRLVGPRTIELRVRAGGNWYGVYRLVPMKSEDDIEMLLQG